ncbi:hypothetical protein DIJ60_37520 [Burkholderia pseudomallei]|nr:hypothetical protein DIJ60_37520 [Burkholderia pseudomallei]
MLRLRACFSSRFARRSALHSLHSLRPDQMTSSAPLPPPVRHPPTSPRPPPHPRALSVPPTDPNPSPSHRPTPPRGQRLP